jgi:predicted unusual protein kinase regulating ubiquinone biosynthesis (AarF/ABC1/UbiB family)
MEEFKKIPVSKVQRAGKFITTGAKIGTNYLRHYGKKLVNPDTTREQLHQDNAADIYASLSELKGSALKVAQMLSMDKNLLPQAYQEKFAMAQYSAPPLSFPLVVQTFQKTFGKSPEKMFDTFSHKAVNAASMGQVHQATVQGKKFAVKVQYPGIADSVRSDLAMIKPIALSMFNLNPVEYDEFIQEVEMRMLEETDYVLELQRSIELSQKTTHIRWLKFPEYYPDYSGNRVLTMDWIEGKPLGEATKSKLPAEIGKNLGQALWDFYHYQMHQIRAVHADPHPGNFIVTPEGELCVIDFGCVKVIPDDFYNVYFKLLDKTILADTQRLETLFYKLRFIYPDDTPKDKAFFKNVFTKLVELLGRPFRSSSFDFADESYFSEMYAFGQELSAMKEFRKSTRPRGVRDAIYINRTYFGLYTILHDLKATVTIHPE